MAKSRKRSFFPVRTVIPTLAGGVGRQDPSKRAVVESENVDNFILSLEHSAEKRRGTYPLERNGKPDFLKEIYNTGETTSKDLWFHWYAASGEQRFLIVVDYSATASNLDQDMLWIYRVKSDDTFVLDPKIDLDLETRKYLTHGNDTKKADEVLRAVAVGSSVLVLNTEVKAGFESAIESDGLTWMKKDYSGNNTVQDSYAVLNYETTVTVDPLNQATAWDANAEYLAESQVFDRTDPKEGEVLRFGLWKVKDAVGITVGIPEDGFEPLPPSAPMTTDNANPSASLSGFGNIASITPFSGGDENTRATSEFKLYYARRALVDATGDPPTDYANVFSEAVSNTALQENVHWEAGGVNNHDTIDEWDGFKIKLPKRNSDGTNSLVSLEFSDSYGQGKAVKAGTEENPTYYIGTSGIVTYGEIANAVADAVNRFAMKEGSSNAGNDYTWDDHVISCTAEVTSAKVTFKYAYPASQWERLYEEDDAGEVIDPDNPRYTEFIKPSDYFYPDSDKKFLGQAIEQLSDLRFPPTSSALSAHNNAEDALKILYPNTGHTDDEGEVTGSGKIYYLSKPYLALNDGHYRVVSIEDQPYLENIRTPDGMSVIDKLRMPKQLVFADDGWTLRNLEWDMRTSGDMSSNPGPSIFHDGEGGGTQSAIKAMSFFRDRLFLASEDKLVSSRLGDFDNLWVNDSTSITVADPIDIRVSSNAFTPITYLQPFRSSLFLGTSGDIQYELLGSENQISPVTAEIAPTSYYGMADHVEPVLMNNNLYFFDKKKLYMYLGNSDAGNQQAMDLSMNAPEYLPENYVSPTVSTDKNSIFVVDKDNSNHIYVYTGRVAGEEVVQNSFYRFVFSSKQSIKSIQAYEDYLYIISEYTVENTENNGSKYITLTKMMLNNLALTEPRIDNSTTFTVTSTFYEPSSNKTKVTTNIPTEDVDTLVITTGDFMGMVFDVTREEGTLPDSTLATLTVSGDYRNELEGQTLKVGKKYKAEIELSEQFYRDENQGSVNGTLNLRFGLFRFRNAGNFNVEIIRQGRTAKTTPFVVSSTDDREVTMDTTSYKSEGMFKLPILGFSDDLSMKIISENIHPLAISNIEFKGKFKFKVRLLGG